MAESVLNRLEEECLNLRARWQREVIAARTTRLQFVTLVAAIAEQGHTEDDPAIAKTWFTLAERLGGDIRRIDFETESSANCRSVSELAGEFFSPREFQLAVAEWRRRIAAALAESRAGALETASEGAPAIPVTKTAAKPSWGFLRGR